MSRGFLRYSLLRVEFEVLLCSKDIASSPPFEWFKMSMDIALPSQSVDIPWNPRTGRQVDAGGLWTQVTAIAPVALRASTCPGKTCRAAA